MNRDEIRARKAKEAWRRRQEAAAFFDWPILLTLNRKHTTGVLTVARLRETMRAFARIRRRAWFKMAVKGGLASIEVSHSGAGWNDHIHAVIECQWLEVARLGGEWSDLVGGGSAHVRRIKPGQTGEALAYVDKGPRPAQCQGDKEELIRVMSAPFLKTAWGCGRIR